MAPRYQILSEGVRDLDLGVDVPPDPSNEAWQKYRQWLKAGNTPLPASVPAAAPPKPEEVAALAQLAEDEDTRRTAKANALVRFLVTHTPAQIDAKVRADVTTLAAARDMLAHLAVGLGALARSQLR